MFSFASIMGIHTRISDPISFAFVIDLQLGLRPNLHKYLGGICAIRGHQPVLQPFEAPSLFDNPFRVTIMSALNDVKTQSDYDSLISSNPPTALIVLSFHTPWAAPCAQQTLILRTLASSYPPQQPPNISFLSIDAEALPDISESFDVTAVPYLVLQRDGKVLETVSGSDATKVREAVEKHAGKGGNTGKLGLPPALETTSRKEEAGAQEGINGHTTNGGSEEKPASDLSKYAPGASDPATAPEMSSTQGQTEELDQRIAELVKAAPVMLFMKGTPSTPQCGFSRTLVSILREKGVRYGFFNILADEDVRQGLKRWADWPTYPQLWCGGDLVGGLDIVSVPPFAKLPTC